MMQIVLLGKIFHSCSGSTGVRHHGESLEHVTDDVDDATTVGLLVLIVN